MFERPKPPEKCQRALLQLHFACKLPCRMVLYPTCRLAVHCLQIAQLPALQRLKLDRCSYSAASMECLSALSGSLTRLESFQLELPPSLSALTGLRHLDVEADELDDVGEFDSTLACLRHLTCLGLSAARWMACRPLCAACRSCACFISFPAARRPCSRCRRGARGCSIWNSLPPMPTF